MRYKAAASLLLALASACADGDIATAPNLLPPVDPVGADEMAPAPPPRLEAALDLVPATPPPPEDVLSSGSQPLVITPLESIFAVFDSDDRRRVSPTTSFPASAQVRLVLFFSDGYTSNGSGTLIGRKYVLTAGHCIYSHAHNGWATKVVAFPGQDGTLKPWTATATHFRSVTGWTEDENNDYDYALVTLDKNIGDTVGWLGLGSLSDDTLDQTTGYIAGYPVGLTWGAQYMTPWGGAIMEHDSTMVYYRIDTTGGMSGSGVYGLFGGKRYVFAVHRGDGYFWLSHYNTGVRITNARFNLIQSWMATGT